jgi:soluble lytic murein transglycosylase
MIFIVVESTVLKTWYLSTALTYQLHDDTEKSLRNNPNQIQIIRNYRTAMTFQLSRLFTTSLGICTLAVTLTCAGAANSSNEQLRKASGLLRNNQNQEALQAALAAPADGPRNLVAGEAALRLKRYDEAVRYLADAERSYPLLADIAASLKADALYGQKKYRDAAVAATTAAKLSPTPATSRRMEKLAADALFAAGDLKAALAAYRQFTARHNLGRDSVDAQFQAALCQEQLGDLPQAIQGYRSIHLQHPASSAAPRALEQLKSLEKKGRKEATSFTAEEQFQRGLLLLANNQPNAAAWAFADIPRTNLSDELLARIELKSGQAAIKQHHYSLAEPFLKRTAAAPTQAIRDEARLMLARLEERQGASDKALARLLALASERGPLADDALLEAALIQKNNGHFSDAAQILQRLIKEFPASDLRPRAGWELAWGQYLAGNLSAAEESLQRLFKDNVYRERALYWHARTKEKQHKPSDAERSYKQLLNDFPYGFYAAWHRLHTNKPTGWVPLPSGMPEPPFPDGSQRIQELASLGLLEEARTELAAFKLKNTDKTAAPGLARLQQLAGDLHGAISTFHQNRPATVERSNLAFWALGYPRPYAEQFSRHCETKGLSEALVLSLAKAESSFRADVKSPAGAIGLMQLMPATARMTAGIKAKNFNPLMLTNPEYNIRLGTRHLRELLNQYHQDTVYTLAAYNAGAGAVNRWRKAFGDLPRDEFVENIPYQETRDYVKKIVGYMGVYRSLYRIQ